MVETGKVSSLVKKNPNDYVREAGGGKARAVALNSSKDSRKRPCQGRVLFIKNLSLIPLGAPAVASEKLN